MSYCVSQVQHHSVKDGDCYLLDSNIWIEILTSRNRKNPRHQQYRKLFQEILKNTKVKIVLPSLIVSEVLNRILREVSMTKYALKNGDIKRGEKVPNNYYKDTYRNTEDFNISYNLLCDDIKIHSSTVSLISDEFGETIKYKHVLSNPPAGLDFNDYYYYILAKKKGYIIVTDDKDFWVQDVPVITQSPSLIEKQKEEIGKIARAKLAEKK
jgi:predicted nucleic acid-binding protein